MLLKEVMAENRGLTLSDLKNRSPEHLSATLTGCESPNGYLEPAAAKEDADDQLSEIASTTPPVDPSCVDLKHSAFLAQLLLEEVDLESTSEPAPPVGKPVLHMQPVHTGDPVVRSPDALARPASNNMPLSEHDTQELWRLLYLKAEGIERQERLQYLRQTWKSSIWSEEDDDSYTLPDPEIPLVYSLHYGQQCPSDWDNGSVPAKTAERQKKKEHGKNNLHGEEDFLQKRESLNLDPRMKKLLITYEEVFGALPFPLSCKKLVRMDLKLKPEFWGDQANPPGQWQEWYSRATGRSPARLHRGPWQTSPGAMEATGDRRAGTQSRRGSPAKQSGRATQATRVRRSYRRLAGAIPLVVRDTRHGWPAPRAAPQRRGHVALPMDPCGDTLPPGTHGPGGRDNAFPSTCWSGSGGT